MAQLKAFENPGGHDAVVTVDGAVVGWISLSAQDTYTANTRGRVPAIDGLSGSSLRDVWGKVVEKVQAGAVTYQVRVTSGPLESAS